jgi:hypothetical protein
MRVIKFRGYRKDIGWKYGYYYIQKGNHYIRPIDEEYISYKVDPESVGEFTGLLDKNSKEIYEGDIVDNAWGRGQIIFEGGGFNIYLGTARNLPDGSLRNYIDFPDIRAEMEVIGTIYENPELLVEK